MARAMTAVERAARDAIKPYVRGGEMTQGEANKTIRDGLALAEHTVRDALAGGFGGVFYYAAKVATARQDFEFATPGMARHMKRVRLLATEICMAVYYAVRAEYKTPEQIAAEDREAPALAAGLSIVKDEAAAAVERTSRPADLSA